MDRNFVLVLTAFFLALAGCTGKKENPSFHKGIDHSFAYAHGLKLIDHADGWTEARIINPWDTTKMLQIVALIPDSLDHIPTSVPDNAILLSIPLKKTVVQTTVHVGLLEELHADDAIAGIGDLPFIKSENIRQKVVNGKVVDCGGWMSPNLERIILLAPDAILVSPYQNGGNYGHITELGIPIIFAADYMEKDPLARAEWVKYYGLLYGKEDVADSLFYAVSKEYLELRNYADSLSKRNGKKSVVMDLPFNGHWYISGHGATNDIFVRDAGAINPLYDVSEGTIVGVSKERVIRDGNNADVWIIRQGSESPLTLQQMKADFPFSTGFRAFLDGEVWACNTSEKLYFEETPFHPERILKDFVEILHNPTAPDSLTYFNRLK